MKALPLAVLALLTSCAAVPEGEGFARLQTATSGALGSEASWHRDAAAEPPLAADLVDRMLIYRAPLLIGEGKSSVGYVGLEAIADAHGRCHLTDTQQLGVDRLEVYDRVRD